MHFLLAQLCSHKLHFQNEQLLHIACYSQRALTVYIRHVFACFLKAHNTCKFSSAHHQRTSEGLKQWAVQQQKLYVLVVIMAQQSAFVQETKEKALQAFVMGSPHIESCGLHAGAIWPTSKLGQTTASSWVDLSCDWQGTLLVAGKAKNKKDK